MENYNTATDNVFNEMVRKLCNTRMQEFLSSQKQKIASNNGHASTVGQNLRDTLHINFQSRTTLYMTKNYKSIVL